MWRASVLTLFPEMFPGPLGVSLIGKALGEGVWSLEVRDIREHGLGKHRSVDDTPAGGGPGMVLRADVAAAAIDAVRAADETPRPLIYLSPRGAPLSQARVRALSEGPGAVLFCGRFEGLDERAIQARGLEEISLGDFVLAGGEVAAMALVEACVRLLPGVMGAQASQTEESFEQGLLEYPQFTRPQVFENMEIPSVLTSGNHAEIQRWRRAESERLTRERRPDLWAPYEKRSRSARRPDLSATRPPDGGKK
jgi:tRNA (guanine37-N1)-methyltransferase